MYISIKKIVLGLFTVVTMSVLMSSIQLCEVKAATYEDINAKEVFLKQRLVDSCTLCSATMMIRRAMIIRGDKDWKNYNESKVSSKAWADGLLWDFEVGGINVTRDTLSGTAAQKKSYLINMLNEHPEGIVLYYSGSSPQPHAVLLTEYTNGKFYCAEPWGGKPEGIIPLSNAIAVTASNANIIWYVTNDLPKITKYTQGTTSVDVNSNINSTLNNASTNDITAVTNFVQQNSLLLPSNYKKMKVSGIKLTSPKSKKITVKWNKKNNITGYIIQYSMSKNFVGAKNKKVKGKYNKVTLGNLKSGKVYYIRICAYNKNINNNKDINYKYSIVKKINVK